MKVWLVHTMAPFCGTDQYYSAYADEDPTDWLYDNWFADECQDLWDSYSFYNDNQYEDEWESMSDEEKEIDYDNNFTSFMDAKYEEWCADCSLDVRESDEAELYDYTPGGYGHLEIIYDERKKNEE